MAKKKWKKNRGAKKQTRKVAGDLDTTDQSVNQDGWKGVPWKPTGAENIFLYDAHGNRITGQSTGDVKKGDRKVPTFLDPPEKAKDPFKRTTAYPMGYKGHEPMFRSLTDAEWDQYYRDKAAGKQHYQITEADSKLMQDSKNWESTNTNTTNTNTINATETRENNAMQETVNKANSNESLMDQQKAKLVAEGEDFWKDYKDY